MEAIIASQTADLRDHLGLGDRDGMPNPSTPLQTEPLFFVERSTRSAKCKLMSCNGSIDGGEYRIAVDPGYFASKTADFYHVACFEKIADLSSPDFFNRINPVTRTTFMFRNIKGSSILDGNYLCHGAAKRLVLQWKVQREAWIARGKGEKEQPLEESRPDFYEILENAGSSKFKASGPVPGMSEYEYHLLITDLAPYESDGPEDIDECNLFDTFLSKDQESLDDPHDLSRVSNSILPSQAVNGCSFDNIPASIQKLAYSADEDLNEHGRGLKAAMGEKAIRAAKRLSCVPMPDFQRMRMGGRY